VLAATLVAGCGSSGFFRNPYTDRIEARRRVPDRSSAPRAKAPAAGPKGVEKHKGAGRLEPVGPRCRIERRALPAGADTLEIAVLDVGQGDAILVIAPNGRTLLVDAGVAFHSRTPRKGEDGYFQVPDDMGEKVVVPYLRRRGIERIDVAVGTHPHADHIGGMVAVARALPIGLFVDPGAPYASDTYETLLGLLAERQIRYRVAAIGDTLALDPRVRVRVLGPDPRPDENVNNSSVVIEIVYGDFVALLTGDAEAEEEEELLRSGEIPSACLLKVGHHGSRSSTTAPFLAQVRPSVAAISCGRRNKFRHPHQSTVEHLEAAGVEVRRTDREGTIRFLSDGKRLQVISERAERR